jgi:hypothetical protein
MAFKKETAGSDTFYANPANKLCELYEGLRNLCFTYVLFDYWEPALPHFKSLGMTVNTPAS